MLQIITFVSFLGWVDLMNPSFFILEVIIKGLTQRGRNHHIKFRGNACGKFLKNFPDGGAQKRGQFSFYIVEGNFGFWLRGGEKNLAHYT